MAFPPTVAPSVRSNLTSVLGRTAAYRGELVTWEEILRSGDKLEPDLQGLAGSQAVVFPLRTPRLCVSILRRSKSKAFFHAKAQWRKEDR